MAAQGDVLLLELPNGRRRPAVVVSSNWFNGSREELVVAAITSHLPDTPDRDDVPLSAADLSLPSDGLVKAGRLLTIQNAQIAKPLGKLPDKALHAVLERVSEVLGLL
jgi:mRNA-degrading endonuclease toxin of MazEF toxin-antitoxin module